MTFQHQPTRVPRLRQGRFQDELAVSQGIVLPILREQGWDIFDMILVSLEYQIGEGGAKIDDLARIQPALFFCL